MKNRFKFRFWFKDTQEMIYSEKFNDVQTLGQWLFGDRKDVVKMQCTGLKDKNGKLIYEDDIVKIEYFDFEIKHRIGIVEWEDDGFCITYHNPKDTKVSGCSLVDIVNGDEQEVIGNIYQDSHLLDNSNIK